MACRKTGRAGPIRHAVVEIVAVGTVRVAFVLVEEREALVMASITGFGFGRAIRPVRPMTAIAVPSIGRMPRGPLLLVTVLTRSLDRGLVRPVALSARFVTGGHGFDLLGMASPTRFGLSTRVVIRLDVTVGAERMIRNRLHENPLRPRLAAYRLARTLEMTVIANSLLGPFEHEIMRLVAGGAPFSQMELCFARGFSMT